jgi:hypothetical protein
LFISVLVDTELALLANGFIHLGLVALSFLIDRI